MFSSVAILKPNSSRPANSERYLVCEGLRHCPRTNVIKQYLQEVVNEFWASKQVDPDGHYEINQLVPLEVIQKDETFYNYIVNSNERSNKIGFQHLHRASNCVL